MQTLVSPWSEQVRLRSILEAMPPVRQTSAGQRTWQTGQRDVVRLRSSSVSLKGEAIMSFSMKTDLIATDSAPKATKRDANNNHDCGKSNGQGQARRRVFPDPEAKHDAAGNPSHSTANETNHYREFSVWRRSQPCRKQSEHRRNKDKQGKNRCIQSSWRPGWWGCCHMK